MPKKTLATAILIGTIAVALLVGQARAASSTYVLKARLTTTSSASGATGATGALTGKLTIAGKKSSFDWTLTFTHLTGTATHAGIYFGTTSKTAQLAMLLCNKCSSGAKSYYSGSYVASPSFVRFIVDGGAYAIIVTKKNPQGEIRGQIKATAA
jgi:hypothetical protein